MESGHRRQLLVGGWLLHKGLDGPCQGREEIGLVSFPQGHYVTNPAKRHGYPTVVLGENSATSLRDFSIWRARNISVSRW